MKIVLAYSGGLDTSVILRWLQKEYGAEVVAFCADLGQGEDLAGIRDKALRTGASRVYVEDLREEFVRDFVFPMFRAAALYEGYYLLGTSIARPLIAKRQVEIARLEGAEAVAHGATGKGNDQVRFELTYQSLEPSLQIIAPWRLWKLQSRTQLIAYATEHNIPVPVSQERPYSVDRNLLHTSYEGGILEDPWQAPPEEMFERTVSLERAENRSEEITLEFQAGNPVVLNGETRAPASLLQALNEIGGRNGIGRVDLVENRYVGMKSRGIYETPGGTILYHAHRAIESLTLDREALHLRDSLAPKYSELVYYGYWFSPEREMLQAAVDHSQKNVAGTVRLKLLKGNVVVSGRKSPRSLYDPRMATFEEGSGYRQADAEGFIRLSALRLRTESRIRKNSG